MSEEEGEQAQLAQDKEEQSQDPDHASQQQVGGHAQDEREVREPDTRSRSHSSPPPPLPAAPKPSADEALHEVNAKVMQEQEESGIAGEESDVENAVDIWAMRPVQALELLCTYVQSKVDKVAQPRPKPPTPPSSGGSSKDSSPAQTPGVNDENGRTGHISPAGAGLAQPADRFTSPGPTSPQHPFLQRVPRASRTPIDSPISHPQSPIPSTHPASPSPLDKTTHIVAQSDALARKFYCKSAPPVTLSDYLARMHKFIPMSVAGYLAAGVYIERLTRKKSSRGRRDSFLPLTPVSSNSKNTALIEEVLSETADSQPEEAPLIEVTPKSVHRLLLSALRVAMKALEDAVYPHRRVALVGGVSELELSRLEVSMCFLADFELMVKLPEMERWVRKVRAISALTAAGAESRHSDPASPA